MGQKSWLGKHIRLVVVIVLAGAYIAWSAISYQQQSEKINRQIACTRALDPTSPTFEAQLAACRR